MSVVSVMLLGGIVTLVLAFIAFDEGVSHEGSLAATGSLLGIAASDLGSGVTEGLFGMHVADLSGSRILLSPAGLLSADIDHTARLESYAAAAEGLYASRSHISLAIADEVPELVLNPHGAVFSIDGESFSVALDDKSVVEGITLGARVDSSWVNTNSSPADSGTVPVSIEVRDANNAIVFTDSALLDLDADNAAFEVRFADGSLFSVSVGSTGSSLLIARASSLEANLTSLDLELSDVEGRLSLASTASLSLASLAGDALSLSRPLIAVEES